jgi:hypothetical protein
MTLANLQRLSFRRSVLILIAVACAGLTFPAPAAVAQSDDYVFLTWDTELTTLNLTGGPVGLPLASDPSNALGDSIDGFGFVDSLVEITLSSQRPINPGPRSFGTTCAFPGAPAFGVGTQCGGGGEPEPFDPADFDEEQFSVQSFFDVFFDVTVTDVDARPGRDYASGTPVIRRTCKTSIRRFSTRWLRTST